MVALRYSGAGEIRSAIRESTLSLADSTLMLGCPRNRRMMLPIIFVNLSQRVMRSPLTDMLASLAWNSGLLNASATNSSTLVAP